MLIRLTDKRIPSFAQIKHLPRFLSSKEKMVLRVCGVIIAFCVFGIFGLSIKDHAIRVPGQGGDYTEGIVGSPRLINPILATSDTDLDISRLLFSGLMTTDTNGVLIPDLAASYTLSSDGKTYTFVLRPNVVWHDDVPFSAADILFTVQAIKNPAWKSPLASRFKNITVTSPKSDTIVFTLSQPSASFLSTATVGILPQHIWQNVDTDALQKNELNIKPVGTGSFRFLGLSKDKKGAIASYTLARNEKYFFDPPKLSTITFKFFPDTDSAANAALTKSIDSTAFLPVESRDDLEKIPSFRKIGLKLPQYTAVFFNVRKNGLIGDPVIRKALISGADRKALLGLTTKEQGVAIDGPVPPGYPEALINTIPSSDTAGATALLEKNGWVVGADGIRKKTTAAKKNQPATTTELALTLTTDESAAHVALVSELQKQWKQLGVRITIEKVSTASLRKQVLTDKKYDAVLFGEVLAGNLDLYPFWHSSQIGVNGLNLSQWSNSKGDQTLEKLTQTTDPNVRVSLTKSLSTLIAQDNAALFLYTPTYTYIMNRRVQGVNPMTLRSPSDRFAEATRWYVEKEWKWK